MSYPAIRVENLGKRYLVDHEARGTRGGYRTLRESLTDLATAPLRRWQGKGSRTRDEFWALNDVSFEVQPGEVVGIIGRNGAGKSTLLKILSQITKPTRGRVELNGRVGSLLEVGTGFHPELTGRENIYLNGSILGMGRREIDRKFDEIVDFAEIEKFLDTPVKRYSSGMYVRLAFAVAAFLDPEILIVDEVLAVGDMAFQRKCMGRISTIGKNGKTVLLVSHNMPAVESLCTRAVLLQAGKSTCDGDMQSVVREYRKQVTSLSSGGHATSFDGHLIRGACLIDDYGDPTQFLPLGGTFRLHITVSPQTEIDSPSIAVGVDDSLGQRMLTVFTPKTHAAIRILDGSSTVTCSIQHFPLAPGEYWIKVAITAWGEEVDTVEHALRFTVVDGDAFGSGVGHWRGVAIAPSYWSLLSDTRPVTH